MCLCLFFLFMFTSTTQNAIPITGQRDVDWRCTFSSSSTDPPRAYSCRSIFSCCLHRQTLSQKKGCSSVANIRLAQWVEGQRVHISFKHGRHRTHDRFSSHATILLHSRCHDWRYFCRTTQSSTKNDARFSARKPTTCA